MKVVCTICSDLFEKENTSVSTPCGHVFHEVCLLQWLDQSKTCPTCRKRVTEKNMIRLYFDQAGDSEVDASILQNELDNLKAKCRGKDMEIRKLNDLTNELRVYVKKSEDEASLNKVQYLEAQTLITAQKCQLKSFTKQISEKDKLQEQVMRLKEQISNYHNVQTLMNGTISNVEDMLQGYGEGPAALKQLATFCSLLKRELQSVTENKQKLKCEVNQLKKEMGCKISQLSEKSMLISSLNSEISTLKQSIQNLESEKESWQKRAKVLQSSIDSPSDSRSAALSRLVNESPAPQNFKRSRLEIENDPINTPRIPQVKHSSKIKYKISGFSATHKPLLENTIPIKYDSNTKNFFKSTTEKETTSITRLGYNGLGGHSKHINSGYSKTKQAETLPISNFFHN